MPYQEVSRYSSNDRVQQEQKEPMPAVGVKRVDKPHDPTDRKHPAQGQDRESGCSLCLSNTNHAKNREQNPQYEKPAPRSPDLFDSRSENITKSCHFSSPFLDRKSTR